MEEQEVQKTGKKIGRFGKFVIGVVALIGLCCCGIVSLFAYYTTTPEYKATSTANAIARASEESYEATKQAIDSATQQSMTATYSAQETATEAAKPTSTATPTSTPVPTKPTSTPKPTNTPLPTDTPIPTNTPLPTSTPVPELKVELVSVTDYSSSDGTLVLYGEIINSGDLPAEEPDIRATLYDSEGHVLVTDTTYAGVPLAISMWFTGVLYPGEKAPFNFYIDDPGEWTDVKIDLTYERANSSDVNEQYKDFSIQSDTGRPINDFLANYRVSGEIVNSGDKSCGPVRFVVTLYDMEGLVVGIEDIFMLDVEKFSPGDVLPFSVDVYARGEVASYSILTGAIKQ